MKNPSKKIKLYFFESDCMDWIVKILPLIISLILPFLKNWLDNLKEKKKNSSEKISNDLKNSEEYIEGNKIIISQLTKDRIAKKLFDNEEINHDEMEFFLKYRDADFWVKKYLKIKYRVVVVRDEAGNITGFQSNYTLLKKVSGILMYIFSMVVFALPYLFFKQYSIEIQKTIEAQVYLITAEIVLFPIFFLFIGVVILIENGKNRDGADFVEYFKENARLI